MGTQAREIVQGNYDLVFTIGAQASQLAKEQIGKRHKELPQVFAAVADPVSIGLVQSLEKPGALCTGVYENPHHRTIVDALLKLKPSIKTVVLVYNPTQGAGLEKQREQLTQLFAEHQVSLVPCQLFNAQEIPTKVGALISNADAVMILKDNTVVPAVSLLAKMCNQHHIPLVASDLESGKQGAVLSVGVHEEEFGNEGALLAIKILQEHKNPSELSCTNPENVQTSINQASLEEQGI